MNWSAEGEGIVYIFISKKDNGLLRAPEPFSRRAKYEVLEST